MDITRIGKTGIPNPCRDLVLNNVLHVPFTQKKALFRFIILPWIMTHSLNFTHISFLLRTENEEGSPAQAV
jgi:hypothetical protein